MSKSVLLAQAIPYFSKFSNYALFMHTYVPQQMVAPGPICTHLTAV